MCQRVYIASSVELPRVRRGKQSPYLEVAPVADAGEVRALFRPDLPFVCLAGGHLGCGCGFPSETTDLGPDPEKLDQSDLASLAALVEYVRPACSKDGSAQIYLCWANQEGDGPLSRRSVSLDELLQPGFRLKHQQILTVARNLDPRRHQTKG